MSQSYPVHSRGSQARILLTSVFGPYALDDEYGSRAMNPMELYHNQVTREQGPFSLRMFHPSLGLKLIMENINSPCTILDFPDLNRFIKELKSMVNVDWASIEVIEDGEIYFMAIFTEIGSPWKVGERIPLKGTATEWVANHHRPFIECDLAVESRFVTGKYHRQHSLRSIAFLPLVISNQVIGVLTVASRQPVLVDNQRRVRRYRRYPGCDVVGRVGDEIRCHVCLSVRFSCNCFAPSQKSD